MPRARVKLALIDSERARKASFNNRKDGLMKKVSELQTLCDVHVCIVIYDRGSNEPFVWPNRPKVEELIKRYLRLPGFMRLKKALCQERYLKEKVEKMQEKNNIILRSNTAKEMVELMHQNQNGKPIYELDLYQTYALLYFLEAKMKEIQIQIAFFEQASAQSETANKLGVPMGNSMEWPYKILGVDNDRCGNGNELGFQMLHQGYVNKDDARGLPRFFAMLSVLMEHNSMIHYIFSYQLEGQYI
ncbi:PREDICTED: agamous-like MADS-box protein AGL80 [Fragaria vesca subsp. vesca]|uniref:agamous-like MADS-box protein AGL80 n=1 Tax=Fragaria vesca subsp. vesca TaxID=101020 RepID=UPI0002C2F6B0|nr:PREDICTED: agamous-like MADS-box protein AGL80 [Fragaria vesca subsp. vesca]